MNDKRIGNCVHHAWSEHGTVCIANDDDGYYITEFNNREELGAFIAQLNAAADKAFGTDKKEEA